MNEKSYGGNNGIREHTQKIFKNKKGSHEIVSEKNNKGNLEINNENSDLDIESYKKAGEIAIQIRNYAKTIIKRDMKLVDIAKKIQDKIEELGGIAAFPVNLSIDDVAAHFHPLLEDEKTASGLLKIDFGVAVNGFIADTAFSLDLSPDNRYKELIESTELALENSLKILEKDPDLNTIGKTIQDTIEKKGFSPIINLSGHSLDKNIVHSGITIPNYANNNDSYLIDGGYAIEPFATTGEGKIYEGPPGNIYSIIELKNTRSSTGRKILEYVWDKYKTLPFSLRELQEKFGNIVKLTIRELEQQGIIQSYPQLIEKSHKPVAQSEHTFVKKGKEIIVTTR